MTRLKGKQGDSLDMYPRDFDDQRQSRLGSRISTITPRTLPCTYTALPLPIPRYPLQCTTQTSNLLCLQEIPSHPSMRMMS